MRMRFNLQIHRAPRASLLPAALTFGGLALLSSCASTSSSASAPPVQPLTTTTAELSHGADNFFRSDTLDVQKVSFRNQFQMNVVGNLYVPKGLQPGQRLPAIVVSHPMGAVKEQSANLYAQKLAEQGFVALSIDLPFWGESDGEPRNAVAPELYSEAFSAAVDFLRRQSFVEREHIGAIGICGSGSYAVSAAKIDPRLKAIATVSMYDMGSAARNGLHHAVTLEQRKALIAAAAEQRDVEAAGGAVAYVGGTPEMLTDKHTDIDREFHDFYRTPRGFSPDTTTHPTLSSIGKFMNFHPFVDIETISPRPLLFITGADAHSREFSEDAYARAAEPKELLIVPNAGHVDLYDRVELIPFARLTAFFRQHLVDGSAATAETP